MSNPVLNQQNDKETQTTLQQYPHLAVDMQSAGRENSLHAGSTPPPTIHKSHTSSSRLGGSVRSISQVLQSKLNIHREEGDFTLGCLKLFHTRTRFLLMVLVLLCLASVWSNILCFNFAIICINADAEEAAGITVGVTDDIGSATNPPIPSDEFADQPTTDSLNASAHNTTSSTQIFTPRQRLYLTSAVAAAALIANFVVVSMVNHFGIRVVFALLGLLSAIATSMMPAAIELGFYYVLAARVLQGVAFAANFPVIGSFTSKWTYYKQNGLFVSALVAYVQFAPAVTMPVSGALCTTDWGWPSVFYAHGAASAVLFTTFALFYRNSPGKHPLVGEVEMKKIAVGKSELGKELLKKIPYAEILKTASVWAVWIAAFGNFFCVNMMFLYSPIYLNSVLHFSVHHTGLSASLAPLAQFTIKLCAGFTSDKIRFLSETNKLRVYNSIAFFGSSIFLAILAFAPTEYPQLCLIILGISAGLLGFTTGGFFKAGPLVSKHYSHFVTGNVSLGITITLLLVPLMVTGFAPHNTPEEWRLVFLFTAGVLCLTNLMFIFMASAEPASWTTDEFSRNASRNKVYATQSTPPNAKKFEVAMG
ncbi:major facilitator superfamily domain-containing protein [Ditylenchus destructor]|uniref:Major facilitator superfamily domain-containing protein n=1 Tax=Ditylenchus destructor TaxID=166010 RepID=A0AAD4N680_9BILA|nr:major facilitator superfamily domain-containing protein [Ditylenchus destructor]